MADFDIKIQPNTGSWGPSTGQVPEKFSNMPYQPFKKEDKIGKVSDWTGMTYGVIGGERRTRMYQSSMQIGGMNQYGPLSNEMNENEFKMVDNNKAQGRPMFRPRQRGQFTGGRGGYQNQNNRFQNNQNNQNQRGNNNFNNQRGGHNQRGNRGRRGNWNNRWNNRWYNNKNINREASVKIESDWDKVETLEFTSLQKNVTKHVSAPKDLLSCGSLRKYNKAADRVTLRKSTKLRPEVAVKTEFHVVTTSEDPGLKQVVKENMAAPTNSKTGKSAWNVLATDSILSALMCCPRSVLPWDIKVYRYGNTLMMDIDDRENHMSPIDFLSVSETAQEPLPEEGVDEINKPTKRSEEATFINQIISQQVLHNPSTQHPPVAGQKEYPFECGKSMSAPSRMYRYREFDLGSDKEEKTKIFVRTEVDGYEPGSSSKPKYVTVKALNEWDSKYCNGINWRSTLEKQTSAVLATEMKNNSFKVARWIMQSKLAGAESIKLAFVTRENVKDDKSHVLVNMESYTPDELAIQAGLNTDNCWGILKSIIEVLKNQKKDGAYYIVRNPNEKELNFYRVPEDDESEEEESDEDDEESGSEESGSEESGSDDSDESEEDDSEEDEEED